jgi:hypothetical protein
MATERTDAPIMSTRAWPPNLSSSEGRNETGLIGLNHALCGLLGGLFCCLLCILAACTTSPQSTSSPTPTPTLAAASPTVTLPPGVARLSFVGNSVVRPSPDGTLLAIVTNAATTLTVYNLAGQAQGHFNASSGHQIYLPGWLPDSSGLFVADVDFNAQTSTPPLLIMAPDGSTKPTGLDAGWNAGDAPLVSPDNQWIADAAAAGPNGQTRVEFVPRAGGTKRMGPTNASWVLGWQSGRLIYYDGSQYAIYALDPRDGSTQFLTGTPTTTNNGVENLKLLLEPDEAGLSLDGQVLSLATGRGEHWVLAGTHMQQDPPTITNFSIFWARQGHNVLGPSSRGTLALIDVLTGAVVHDTGIAGSEAHAVAGDWAITSTDTEFHAVNYAKDVDHALGSFQGYAAFALGQSRVLLHQQQAPGNTYTVDPASLTS